MDGPLSNFFWNLIDFYEKSKNFGGILTFSTNPLLVCTTSTKAASSFEIVFEASLRSNHGLAGSKAKENCRNII